LLLLNTRNIGFAFFEFDVKSVKFKKNANTRFLKLKLLLGGLGSI